MSKIYKKDYERNVNNLNQGKELDISLRLLRNHLRLKKNMQNSIKPLAKSIRLPERTLKGKVYIKTIRKCVYCRKQFVGISIRKFCSSKCKRKRLNAIHCSYVRKKKKTDWQFALKTRLRDNLRETLRYYFKTGKQRKHQFSDGYIDYQSIIDHLGQCPGNRHEWHIGHINPLCKFDFSNINEIKKAFASNNLRWLPAKENLRKGIYEKAKEIK